MVRPRKKKASQSQGGRKYEISVDVEDKKAFKEVEHRLVAAGLRVDGSMEAIGVITGWFEASPSVLRKVAGVTGVQESAQISIAPPDSAIQ